MELKFNLNGNEAIATGVLGITLKSYSTPSIQNKKVIFTRTINIFSNNLFSINGIINPIKSIKPEYGTLAFVSYDNSLILIDGKEGFYLNEIGASDCVNITIDDDSLEELYNELTGIVEKLIKTFIEQDNLTLLDMGITTDTLKIAKYHLDNLKSLVQSRNENKLIR